MSKPEPKFSLAESVMIRLKYNFERNCDYAIIVEREFGRRAHLITDEVSFGWVYRTNMCPDDSIWVFEESLRPRPEPATASYGELIASIKAIKPSKVKGEYMSSLVDFYLREIDQDANN